MSLVPIARALSAICAASLSTGCGRAPPIIVNESASLPRGVYRLTNAPPARGSIVVLVPSAEGRRYLADLGAGSKPRLIKRVVAAEGDFACRIDERLFWPGGSAVALSQDRDRRALPQWRGCRRLAEREMLVLGDTPLSFDSRYLGPVRMDDLVGAYEEVWRW